MIPAFSAADVLPPFAGSAAASADRSPYLAGIDEVVQRFATSAKRCAILDGWLRHRAELHALELVDGFQWVDGSFCERLEAREPNDIDMVTFLAVPAHLDRRALLAHHRRLFDRADVKRVYACDVFFEELRGGLAAPRRVSYWYSLFSHRRDDLTWKGILEVPLGPERDANAKDRLTLASQAFSPASAP